MSTATSIYRHIETFRLVRSYAEGDGFDELVAVYLTVDHTAQTISIRPERIAEENSAGQPRFTTNDQRNDSFEFLDTRSRGPSWKALAKLIDQATDEGQERLRAVQQLGDKPVKELYS